MITLALLLVQQVVTCSEPCTVTITEQDPIVEPAVLTPEQVTVVPATIAPAKVTKRPPIVSVQPYNPGPPPETYDLTLTGDQGWTQKKYVSLASGYKFDASAAVFHVNNSKTATPTSTNKCDGSGSLPVNPVPVQIEKTPGFLWNGGTFDGDVPQDYGWTAGYCDSSFMRILESPDATVRNVTAWDVWDGIRFRIGSNNFTATNIYIRRARDDAFENDYRHSALLKNVLVSGALSCVALSPPSGTTIAETDGTNQTMRLEDFHCRLAILNQDGDMTHGSPFKAGEDGRDLQVVANNITLAMSDATPNGGSRLRVQMDRFTCEASCYLLNLSDTPLASSHTWRTARPNTTLLEGAAARSHWDQVEAAWLAANRP